jgi:hypothetical protein
VVTRDALLLCFPALLLGFLIYVMNASFLIGALFPLLHPCWYLCAQA